MLLSDSSRQWMQALARVRTKVARLRARSEDSETVELLDEALALADAIRLECAALHERAATLAQQVRERDAQAQQLIDSQPMATIQTDCTGTILEANAAAAALLGVGAGKLRQERLIYFCEDRPVFAAIVGQLPHDAQPVRVATRIRPRDRAPFESAITLLRDPRDGECWLWFVEPISVVQRPARTRGRRAPVSSPSAASGN